MDYVLNYVHFHLSSHDLTSDESIHLETDWVYWTTLNWIRDIKLDRVHYPKPIIWFCIMWFALSHESVCRLIGVHNRLTNCLAYHNGGWVPGISRGLHCGQLAPWWTTPFLPNSRNPAMIWVGCNKNGLCPFPPKFSQPDFWWVDSSRDRLGVLDNPQLELDRVYYLKPFIWFCIMPFTLHFFCTLVTSLRALSQNKAQFWLFYSLNKLVCSDVVMVTAQTF